MRIGFHYHTPSRLNSDGKVMLSGPDGVFIDALAACFGELVCFMHSPRKSEETNLDYQVQASNVRLKPVGLHSRLPFRIGLARWNLRPLKEESHRLDALIVRAPTPLLKTVANAAGKCPLVLLVVGDYVEGVGALGLSFAKTLILRRWAKKNRETQWKLAHETLTFVNNKALLETGRRFGVDAIEIATSALRESEFFAREDTCQGDRLRLLFVGRLDKSKGVLDLVRAVACLVEMRFDAAAEFIGRSETDDKIVMEMHQCATALGVSERLSVEPRLPRGLPLLEKYRAADILIVPSYHEGFPRVVWEAMANSLPVIATAVGGIPSRVQHERDVLLVEAGDPKQIAQAVARLASDPVLRRGLITNGISLAKANTVEALTKTLAASVIRYVEERKAAGRVPPVTK